MIQPPRRPIPLLGELQLGDRAARALTTELERHAGPKSGLVIAATGDSAVLSAALSTVRAEDTLTVVPLTAAGDEVREQVAAFGSETAARVRVVDTLAEADPADIVVIAEPLTGTAEATRDFLEEVGKHLAEGGVLAVAGLAVPGAVDGAAAELERQAAFAGVGSDLVLRNSPPVRVHRLRFAPAPLATVGRLTPAFRPSSVPLARGMNIDSNGVAAAGIALGLAALIRAGRPTSRLWLVPALAALPVAAFFRDPERQQPDDPDAILAASDGTVLSVERVVDPRLGVEEFLRVAVFLSVLDVHVNRAPVPGRVAEYFVVDGGYAAAMKPAAEHNVAAYTVLDTEHGRVAVAQRTGLIARRIVQRAPVGSLLARGERFGLIRFGSRTDVYLPVDAATATVSPGDKVSGGTTVIARWH